MFIGEIARTGIYITSISSVLPFIYRGYTKYRSLKTEWGETCDDLFTGSTPVKVIQVTGNYLNKYHKVNTYNEMLLETGSWYFDVSTNSVYIHVVHDSSLLSTYYDYGYAFGISTNGVVYIDDFPYIPIVKSYPRIEIEADYVGQSTPTGIVGSITLNNAEYITVDGSPEGALDFLLTESIENNDLIMYDYTDNIKTETGKMNIESVNQSLQEVVLELQDMRMK